jgi:hypothetical protein
MGQRRGHQHHFLKSRRRGHEVISHIKFYIYEKE